MIQHCSQKTGVWGRINDEAEITEIDFILCLGFYFFFFAKLSTMPHGYLKHLVFNRTLNKNKLKLTRE